MPSYPGVLNSKTVGAALPGVAWQTPFAIWEGEQFTAFNNENVTAPQASDRCALAMGAVKSYPQSLSVEVSFDGDPGTFEIDIQDADTDADAYFQNVPAGGVINATKSATIFTARAELVPIKARFARLRVVTLTNAVKVTAVITR